MQECATEETCSIAHFSSVYLYPVPHDGRQNDLNIYIYFFKFFPLLYHQSILDYKYMYVGSRKWQYKT